MVEREIFVYISLMIWKLTQEHYVPPPNHCIMAMTCNHSGIPLCGFEKNQNCYRMFLDECDLYEYNCDNKAEFFSSEINNCGKISDDNHGLYNSSRNLNGTIVSSTTIKMTSSAETTTAKTTTVVPFSLSTVSNITTCTKDNNLTIVMVREENNTKTLDVTRVSTNVTNKEKSNTDKNITVASKTTEKNDSKLVKNITTIPNNVTENEKSNVDKNVTVPSKTILVTSTVSISTKKNLSNTTTTGNITDKTSNGILNHTTIRDLKDMTAIVSTTTVKLNVFSIAKEETTESMTKQTTDKVDVKPENCDFPSYCDRPKTWLTTSKGETRDFYRIIIDNKGK